MVAGRNDRLTGGREIPAVVALWGMFCLVAVEIVVTYSRIPPARLYAVSGSGVGAGFGRALVFLNFPVALAALPVIALAAERLRRGVALAVVAAVLCAAVFWPGVVNQNDLDARPVNALAAAGVALAVALSVAAGPHREGGRRARGRAPRPPPRHGRRPARARRAPARAARPPDPGARAPARRRPLPRPRDRLRPGEHRAGRLARAGREARLDDARHPERPPPRAHPPLARHRPRGRGLRRAHPPARARSTIRSARSQNARFAAGETSSGARCVTTNCPSDLTTVREIRSPGKP